MAGVNAISQNTQNTATDTVKKILGKDDFLKLLITQLKYQDPMEPTDNKEFIAQMAQFSSLEQMSNMSTGFEKMAAMQELGFRELSIGQAVNMIGRIVSAVMTSENENGEVSTTNVTGTVTGMKIVDGVPNVVVNGREIPISYIEEVKMTSVNTQE